MIPKECKRLAEVDFPIAVVSKHAAREKSIRHGHPSTLHLWWARRPLASCRAVLLGLLLPDPCDEHCPKEFKTQARELLKRLPGRIGADDLGLRHALLKFIGDFANWDHAANATFLEVGRRLVKAAHPEETPLVVDPFAGGGSIPLEALRLGCEAFASDLNPVACLILKVMLEDIPRHGPQLAEELRRVGRGVKQAAEKELTRFYPHDPNGARPIAYLWARTVRCESPNCGVEIPLMRSFWLCKKANRRRALRLVVERPKGTPPLVHFEIFEPKSEKNVPKGTVTRGNATCLCCNVVLPVERVRAQLTAQHGGADVVFDGKGRRVSGSRLLAVVTIIDDTAGRQYRLATDSDYVAVYAAQQAVAKLPEHAVPDELLPPRNTLGLRVPNYGIRTWGDLYSARQKLALATIVESIRRRSDLDHLDDIEELLALCLSRTADYSSANCSLHAGRDVVRNTWARNALPVVWDYYEAVPLGEGSGNFDGALEWVAKVAENVGNIHASIGQIQLADACESPLPDGSVSAWFTDPPYYNAIGYAESADFFFVWLKRVLSKHSLLRDPFDPTNPLTPKERECIQDETYERPDGKTKDAAFFESRAARAFAEGRRLLRDDGVGCVVFAHKTTEGWESLLSGMIRGGWVITGSWPIETEMKNKVSGAQSGEKKAMLLASVHLICRPRPHDAPVGDWGEVLRELPKRIGGDLPAPQSGAARQAGWMERLQTEGVRGADLVFACIGPALEIFSRYSRVETAEGREVGLAEYLMKVWEVVGRSALEQVLGTADLPAGRQGPARNGAAGAVEEDARLTALFLWTLQSTNGDAAAVGGGEAAEEETSDEDEEEETAPQAKAKGYSLVFDVVRRFAQPLGINLPKWENRIIETKKGVVRLFAVAERAKILFGEDGAETMAAHLEKAPAGDTSQLMLFPEAAGDTAPGRKAHGRGRQKGGVGVLDDDLEPNREATTLDRVHVAMLLQASGRANALRALLKTEQDRGPDFLRLANALSALYPKGSEEKRLLDAMLLAVPK